MQIEHITLVRTPQGTPTEADFAFGSGTLPAHAEGQALVRVLALSLDPYLRSAMAGRHLSAAIHPGDVVRGEGLVQVLESRHPRLTPGTQWVAQCGWRSHALLGVEAIEQARRVGPEVQPPTLALGALGMPGLTAWAGFKRLADAKPGDTLVVSAASGPVGATVGQLARLAGCRVIGIAGGPEKCAWVTRRAGFDACIDYRAEDLREALRRHAPDGVDIYFDNVGGDVLLAVCEQLAVGARVVLCGLVSSYNGGVTQNTAALMQLVNKAARMEGFLVSEYLHRYAEVIATLQDWAADGSLKYRIEVLDGLDKIVEAMTRVFHGKNQGVQLVKIAQEGTQ